jgi:hydrogenase-4 component E
MSMLAQSIAELVLLLIVLTDFLVLGTSRLSACIRAIALQGGLLAVLPIVSAGFSVHSVILSVLTLLVKGAALPWLLAWAIREAAIRREVEPLVSSMASMLLGAVALGLAFAVASRLPRGAQGGLLVPVALMTLIAGLVVLITRSKALSQVVGYLMLENGVYLFGLKQAARVPFLVEIAVLLDVFVGVFIMGIVVFHINREFDSISAAKLTELRES